MPKLTKQWKMVLWISTAVALAVILSLVIIAIVKKLPILGWQLFKNKEVVEEQVPEAVSVYTGLPITKEQAQNRALGAMIAGDAITRPQSGLGVADVVIEMEAAQGITRFLAIFQTDYPEEIGSIRSVRNEFIDIADGFDAVLVHWGGEKKALERLASKLYDEIDQFANGDLFYRKLSIPAPHNGFTTSELMQVGFERNQYDHAPEFHAWVFEEAPSVSSRPSGGTLDLDYGNATFDVSYDYDAASNSYLRTQGGEEHQDALTGQIIAPKNVLVLRADHFTYDQIGGYLTIDVESGGDCTLFKNGAEYDCSWSKGDSDMPIVIASPAGEPLSLTPGQTYVQVMSNDASVTWQPLSPTNGSVNSTKDNATTGI